MQALKIMIFSVALAVVSFLTEAHANPLNQAPAPNLPATAGSLALTPLPTVLTFQAWKTLRVDEARFVLERLSLESQIQIQAAKVGSKPPIRIESRIEQARINLEIAQELTVNDYLAIYLSRFKSREIILDVARRMSADEIADLMMSHQRLAPSSAMADNSPVPSPRLSPRPL